MPDSPAAAFITATFTASTRLICPAPIAASRSARANTTALDFTWAETRQASRRAAHSASVGGRRVTTRRPDSGRAAFSGPHDPAASVTRSRPWTRMAPRTDRTSRSSRTSPGDEEQSASTTRRFFFPAKTARASSSASGATTASMKVEVIASAAARSTHRFNPTIPPNADRGSTSRAAT